MIMDSAELRQPREECAIPPSAMCYDRCSHLGCEQRWTPRHDSAPPAAATAAAASVAATRGTAAAGKSSGNGRAGRGRRRLPRGPTLAFALSCVLILAILDLDACSAFFFPFGGTPVSPRFIKALKNVTVQLGKPFNLSCTVRAGPLPYLTMLHNGQAIKPQYLVDKSKLESTFDDQELLYAVESAKISDIGVYECRVEHSNGANASVTALVDVLGEGKPVLRPMNDQEITQGSNVKLVCIADGSPRPAIRWTLPAHVTPSSRVLVDDELGTVTIIHAEERHKGEYVCQASNSHGTARHAVRLNVFDLGVPFAPTRLPVLDPTMTKHPSPNESCRKCKAAAKQDVLGITDRDLVIIIACSGAIIVIACVSTLVCYVQMIRRMPRPKVVSPPTSQMHTDSTTGTIATQSPSQTLRYDDDKHGTCL